jgi:hypothetical protein
MTLWLLAVLGIPPWLLAIFLFLLLRGRSAVKKIPGSFACKARSISGDVGGLHDQFRRYSDRAHWVHDVLVVHGGNPFLTRTFPFGIADLAGQPEPPDETAKHLKRVEDPVSVRYRLDSGAVIELVCARSDAGRALGPFSAPTQAA